MNYYVLELRSKEESDWNLVGKAYDSKNKNAEPVFDDAKPLKGSLKTPFTVILNDRSSVVKKKLTDRIAIDAEGLGLVFLVSPDTQKLFEELKLPTEFYDVKIKGKKTEIDDYKFVNIIGRIECVDKEKSELEYLDESIIQIYDRLVLDESKIPKNTDIFLLGEDITMMIIVSERVKTAIEQANLTGFEFKKPEDYKTFR